MQPHAPRDAALVRRGGEDTPPEPPGDPVPLLLVAGGPLLLVAGGPLLLMQTA